MGYISPVKTLCLSSILVFAGACAASQRGVKETKRETVRLSEAAEIYWRALRFQDYGVAGTYILEAETRASWLMEMGQAPPVRYSSAVVVSVDVGEEHPVDDNGITREGTVYIQVEGYRLPDTVVERRLLEQEWALSVEGWVLLEAP